MYKMFVIILFLETFIFILNTGNVYGIFQFTDDIDKFEFTRIEPANDVGITTKVIANIHRPAKGTTETWRLNREFTPVNIVKTLNEMCSDKLIERQIKWNNCKLDSDGLTAELTYGEPTLRNKTFSYLAVSYKPFLRFKNGQQQKCILAITEENPAYFLIETFSKVPSNNSFPTSTSQNTLNLIHSHRLGKFSVEFLSIYGNSIDKDGIYNFSSEDYFDRDQLYDCFLTIGSSESAAIIEEKCPILCKGEDADNLEKEFRKSSEHAHGTRDTHAEL